MFLDASPLLLPRVSRLVVGVGGVSDGEPGAGGESGGCEAASAVCIQMSLVASSLLMKLTLQSALGRLWRPSL